MDLIDILIKEGWLKTPRIIEAFKKIERADFLPPDIKDLAEINEALPIGWGQTISQPLVVAFMIEQLQPWPGDKVLDIGSGSGWTSALLAYIVSEGELNSKLKAPRRSRLAATLRGRQMSKLKGKVIAIEIIPELKEFGEKNVAKYNFMEKGIAEFIYTDGSEGYNKEAPYDRILASASAEKLPQEWKEQLKTGGRIVTSIKNSIWVFEKKSENEFKEKEFPGFVFVPLIQK